jgi:hypothetical protein
MIQTRLGDGRVIVNFLSGAINCTPLRFNKIGRNVVDELIEIVNC